MTAPDLAAQAAEIVAALGDGHTVELATNPNLRWVNGPRGEFVYQPNDLTLTLARLALERGRRIEELEAADKAAEHDIAQFTRTRDEAMRRVEELERERDEARVRFEDDIALIMRAIRWNAPRVSARNAEAGYALDRICIAAFGLNADNAAIRLRVEELERERDAGVAANLRLMGVDVGDAKEGLG